MPPPTPLRGKEPSDYKINREMTFFLMTCEIKQFLYSGAAGPRLYPSLCLPDTFGTFIVLTGWCSCFENNKHLMG